MISLFYLANCPLPFESDPIFDTAVALQYCDELQTVFSRVFWYNVYKHPDLPRVVSHIHTCLTERVKFVQESCKSLAPGETPTFYVTPFDIPHVVNVLNNLAKLSKVSILSYLRWIEIVFIATHYRKNLVQTH